MTDPRDHLIDGLRNTHALTRTLAMMKHLPLVAGASLLVLASFGAAHAQSQTDKQTTPPAASSGVGTEPASPPCPPASGTAEPDRSGAEQPSEQQGNRAQQQQSQQRQQSQQQWYSARTGEIRGSRLIGVTVRNDAGENIGDINEIVIARDGRVAALVIGVGGFLGIGERNVAVAFNTVRMTVNSSNQPIVVLTADRSSLTNAPEWKWSDADQSGVTGSGTGPSVTPPSGTGAGPGMGQTGVPRGQR